MHARMYVCHFFFQLEHILCVLNVIHWYNFGKGRTIFMHFIMCWLHARHGYIILSVCLCVLYADCCRCVPYFLPKATKVNENYSSCILLIYLSIHLLVRTVHIYTMFSTCSVHCVFYSNTYVQIYSNTYMDGL